MSSYDLVRDWRKNNKMRLFQAFDGKCGHCSVVDDPVIYDFHHLDPSKKDFILTNKIRSWKRTIVEAEKCVMLCAPCHRKLHAGLIELSPEIQRFDETLISTIETHEPCPICQTSKPKSQITCSLQCAGKRRETKWDVVDLVTMSETMTNGEIARIVGCSDAAVWKRRKKLGLKPHPRGGRHL